MGALEPHLLLPLASIAASAHQHHTEIYTTVTPTYLTQPPVLLCAQGSDTTPKLSYSQMNSPATSKQHPRVHIHPCSNKGKARVLLHHEAGSPL